MAKKNLMIFCDTNVIIAFFNSSKAVLERVHAEIDRIALTIAKDL